MRVATEVFEMVPSASLKSEPEGHISQFLRDVPCGKRMPDSIHAVTVSMPLLRDLVEYEEQNPSALARIQTGYPRFHTHPYIVKIQEYLAAKLHLNGRPLLILSSENAANALNALMGNAGEVVQYKQISGLVIPEDLREKGRALRQHTGTHISSRRGEDFLIKEGLLASEQSEASLGADSERHVARTLKEAYEAATEDDVFLCNAGMNAVYAAYQSINSLQAEKGKDIWIQFGWLFMDTMKLIEKIRAPGTDYHRIYDVFDLEGLKALLCVKGTQVAGIITETPSNPLVRTPDVRELKRLAEQYDCALIIDSTLGTPYNVDVLPHADLVIESLTKYANGAADVMMGAILLNSSSRYHEALRTSLPNYLEPPYVRDVNRLAFQISHYAERMSKVNANTIALVEFLATRKTVKKVFWAYQEESRANYEKIHRKPNSPGGIITLVLQAPLASVYDALKVAKGPSLGAEFTLVGPYLYHAHYDLVSSEEGRELLISLGLTPELLRISVGVEPIEDLIEAFSLVL